MVSTSASAGPAAHGSSMGHGCTTRAAHVVQAPLPPLFPCAHRIMCSAVRMSGAPRRCSTASPRASSGSQWRVRWWRP